RKAHCAFRRVGRSIYPKPTFACPITLHYLAPEALREAPHIVRGGFGPVCELECVIRIIGHFRGSQYVGKRPSHVIPICHTVSAYILYQAGCRKPSSQYDSST